MCEGACDLQSHLQEATLELCTILREKDGSSLSQWRLKDPWVTVDHLIRATGGLQHRLSKLRNRDWNHLLWCTLRYCDYAYTTYKIPSDVISCVTMYVNI